MFDLVGGGGSVVDVGGQRKLTITKDEHLCSISGGCGVVAARKSPQLPKTSIPACFWWLWIVIVVASARESPQPPKSSVHARFQGS